MTKEDFFEPLDDEEKQLIKDLENGVYGEIRDPTLKKKIIFQKLPKIL